MARELHRCWHGADAERPKRWHGKGGTETKRLVPKQQEQEENRSDRPGPIERVLAVSSSLVQRAKRETGEDSNAETKDHCDTQQPEYSYRRITK